MKHELPPLPYAYNALEPFIDAQTMELHHTKHHQTYVTKLNEALGTHPALLERSLEELLMSIDTLPEELKKPVRNHGGGHYNHSFFWKLMKAPTGGGQTGPKGPLSDAIKESFRSFDLFKEAFNKAAAGHFGSGWVWLVINHEGKLEITAFPNQDAPIMNRMKPVLGVDVWEHAYYLKYQNRRPEYLTAWWNVLNWEEIEKNFTGAIRG
jgi:superoxide dismutase, Fe-Mn family